MNICCMDRLVCNSALIEIADLLQKLEETQAELNRFKNADKGSNEIRPNLEGIQSDTSLSKRVEKHLKELGQTPNESSAACRVDSEEKVFNSAELKHTYDLSGSKEGTRRVSTHLSIVGHQ